MLNRFTCPAAVLSRGPCAIAMASLLVAHGALHAQVAANPPIASPAAQAAPNRPALAGTVVLHPKLLVQLLVERSAEIEYSRLQVDVARQLSRAEAALYEPILYTSLRHEDRERQRGVEERLSSFATSGIPIFEERLDTAETGLRSRLPTGAELSLSYRLRHKRNNIISNNRPDYKEYDGAIVLTVKQPLWRGAGKSIVETDKKVAEVERAVSAQQFKQQLLKTTNDGLSAYWQLYRALEVNTVRKSALETAQQIYRDTEGRVSAGKVPESTLIEVRAAILGRELEVVRSEQAVREAQSRLATMLNISTLANQDIRFIVDAEKLDESAEIGSPARRYETALGTWPALKVANLRAEQATLRRDFADNARKPALDLVFSRSNSGLASENDQARSITESGRYPEWYVGVNFEMPIGGNQKATAQYHAQAARVRQAEVEIDSIRQALANDILSRSEQVAEAQQELQRMRKDSELRAELLRIEQVRFNTGMGLMSQLLQRAVDLNESNQRLAEAQARLGQANDALLMADGTLLDAYGVTIKD